MKSVAAAFGHQRRLRAGGTAEGRIRIGYGRAELLDRFGRRRYDGEERAAKTDLVSYINAVERIGVLICARTGNLATWRDEWLQAQQIGRLPIGSRQPLDPVGVNYVAD